MIDLIFLPIKLVFEIVIIGGLFLIWLMVVAMIWRRIIGAMISGLRAISGGAENRDYTRETPGGRRRVAKAQAHHAH